MPENKIAKIAEPFVCGGTAAVISAVAIHPMDLAKVRMQLFGQLNPGKPVPSFTNILSNMVKSDGITSIYKGVDAAIGRQLVYGTARIGLNDAVSAKLKAYNEGKPISFAMKTVGSMAAGAIAVCIGAPFDVALVRLQSDSMVKVADRKNYKNVMDALTRTVKEEGPAALYRGLAPNVLRGMANNVGQLACYDQAKEVFSKLLNDPMTNGPAPLTVFGASLVAGFTQAAFAMPFDLIKSRLMAQKADALTGKLPYSGVTDCAVQILKKDGPRGFFSGFSAYYVRCAQNSLVLFLVKESIASGYRKAWGY